VVIVDNNLVSEEESMIFLESFHNVEAFFLDSSVLLLGWGKFTGAAGNRESKLLDDSTKSVV